jgi:hypothetical protein
MDVDIQWLVFFRNGSRRLPSKVAGLVEGRPAGPAAASASAPVTPSSSMVLVAVAAVATTVSVVVAVAVSVLVTVGLVLLTSLMVVGTRGRAGKAGRLPVAGLSVAPAVPGVFASVLLPPFFRRVHAVAGFLRAVHVRGRSTPHPLGTGLGCLAGWLEVLVEVPSSRIGYPLEIINP